MAEKRMFTKTIVDSDIFLDMPQSTQNLYFHLNMRADDEGFINSPKKIMRMVGANQNDIDILLAKRYLLGFESGVVVVKHWKLHNAIRKDRLKETVYTDEKMQITEKENGVYTDNLKALQPIDNQLATKCQHRLDKTRLDKSSIVINGDFEEEKELDLETHFESVWVLYPNKKGKGQYSGKKAKLRHIATKSIDEWKRLIERYVSTVKDKQYLMHGSTFFNSGYVDYLDENWVDQERDVRDQSSFRTHDEWRYHNYIDVAGKNPTENDKIRIEQLRVKMEESLKCLV